MFTIDMIVLIAVSINLVFSISAGNLHGALGWATATLLAIKDMLF